MNRWPFYRAADSKVGDVMPCYFNDRFYIYYLRFGVYGQEAYNEWSVRETTDFVSFSEDRRVGIFGGTGEIIPLDGKYHLFKEVEPNVIGHYVGDTPYGFTDTGLRLPSDDNIYVSWAWRDPKIFWVEEEKCYWMLVATNVKTENPVYRHGCVGLCKSPDLYHWQYCKPLFSPLAHDGTYECPDLFQMGQWYYLIYSNANYNKLTHYVKGKSLYGPWEFPENDTLDSFLFYAGRTAGDGKNRYITAWNAERTGEDLAMKLGLRDVDKTPMFQFADLAPLGYAGDMVIHKLGQKENGDLTCQPIPNVMEAFWGDIPFVFTELQGSPWQVLDNGVSVDSPMGYSCGLGPKLPDCCCMMMDLSVSGLEGGLLLGADEHFHGKGLFLRFQPGKGRLQVQTALRDKPYIGYCMPFAVEQELFVQPEDEDVYHLCILQNGELLTVYVNGSALSLRSENAANGHLGLYAYGGSLQVFNIQIKERGDTK